MTEFQVILQKQPVKYYKKAEKKTARLLEKVFKQLEQNPFYLPGKIRRLKGLENRWRYNTDGLRVVYEIDIAKRKVGVIAILPRGDVYKRI